MHPFPNKETDPQSERKSVNIDRGFSRICEPSVLIDPVK
jgi:hypothetical protein